MAAIKLAVNGTLMRGLALNRNMLDAGASFLREAETEPAYRLWSIGDQYPAMQKVREGGAAIHIEVWDVPYEGLVDLLRKEPPGLCVGRVTLSNGEEVFGILGEAYLCESVPAFCQT